MEIVTICLSIALLLAILEDKKKMKKGMLLSFFIVTMFFSLRYGYGNDFFNYNRIFEEVNHYPSLSLCLNQLKYEAGWIIACYILKPFGFQFLLFVQLFIVNIIVYKLIKKYVPKGWYFYALFFYLFHTSIFLLNLSMLRQGTAGILSLLAISLVMDRKIVKSILIVTSACFIHKSAMIVFPLILLIYFESKINMRYILYVCIVFSTAIYINPEITSRFYDLILKNDLSNGYEAYLLRESVGLTYGIGVLLQILALAPCFWQFSQKSKVTQMFCVFYSFLFVFMFLANEISLISRLSAYFMPFGIFLFPRIYKENANPLLCTMSIVCMSVYLVYSYFVFFSSATYGAYYGTYNFCF